MLTHPYGKRLFTFAVIADTHLNEQECGTNSPFEVNRLANRRLRFVIDDLNRRELAFVMHLGDVVHPVPSTNDQYQGAADRFFELVSHLKHPLHIIPGNHDVGDKPLSWGPAGMVRQHFLDAWSESFGEHYFHFLCQGVVFIGINCQLLGSGLPLEEVQRDWLRKTIAENTNNRIMLFSHYPPFLLDENEDEHYDNLGIQHRQELLELVESHSVEAIFAGHVHHFWYHRLHNCNFYLLPATSFTRQDYSEMFRIGPNEEYGRNDQAKLGYLLIHLYEKGHEFEMIRSAGQELEPNSTLDHGEFKVSPVTALSNRFPVMGFELRNDWCELTQIPPSGGLDEFDRKTVRNDYPLLALWEMGARRLRVPLSDVVNDVRRRRLNDMADLGFKFTLYSVLPTEYQVQDLVLNNLDLFESWEISGNLNECIQWAQENSEGVRKKEVDLFYSPLRSKQDILRAGNVYYHVINHGFMISDSKEELQRVASRLNSLFTGAVFRCSFEESVVETLEVIKWFESITGLDTSIHLRLRKENPAENQHSECALCNRLAEAMYQGWRMGYSRIFCDTLSDVDRGYFPRAGLLDREFNPRAGARLVKQLHGLFSNLRAAREKSVKGQSPLASADETGVVVFTSNCRSPDTKGYWLDWMHGEFLRERQEYDGYPQIFVPEDCIDVLNIR